MSKWYQVTVQATKVVVVEIADDSDYDPEEEAADVAKDEVFLWHRGDVETFVRLLETPAKVKAAKGDADEVCPLPKPRG